MDKKILLPTFMIPVIIFVAFLSVDFVEKKIPDYTKVSYDNITTNTNFENEGSIKVGILHSLSGTMAISETPVVDATILAIEEINAKGGVLGKKVEYVLSDGKSDWPTFALEAEKLIEEDEVSAIFGGWTSASRKTIKPVIEEYDHLLFYPVQYEGLEKSENIFYSGASPNQQVLPAVDWAFENIGTTFFLVGSDYVFPRSANEIIKYRVNEIGGKIVGEEYVLLGSTDFEEIIDQIIERQPDVILNTINGDSNIAFFQMLRENNVFSNEIPTISFSVGENEIVQLGPHIVTGDYAAWNYFQSIDSHQNENFVKQFKTKFGEHRTTSDPMVSAYNNVFHWAKAVEFAGSTEPKSVREHLKGITHSGPDGPMMVDSENNHLSKIVRIGKILPDGQFLIVFSSESPIDPMPYPAYQSEQEWNDFLQNLYVQWGENWANPGV